MSPEQWNNSHDVDPRGDIYSLGCTLYFLLTGHAPFDTPQHKSATAKMRGHVLEAPPSIRKERPDVPKRLATVIERMLAKDPGERYQTAADLAVELEEFIPGCDLPSLSAAAQGLRPMGAAADIRTDPESATILVGSSAGGQHVAGSKVKPLSATGIDTAVGRARTNLRIAAGVRPKRSRGWIGWLVSSSIVLVLIGAGAGYWLSQGETDSGADDQHLAASGQTGARPSDNTSTSSTHVPAPNGADATEPRAADPVTNGSVAHSGQAAAVDAGAANSTGDGGDVPTSAGSRPGNPAVEPKMAASGDNPPPPLPITPVFDEVPPQVAKEQQPFLLLVSLANQVELKGKIAFTLVPGAPQGMRIDPVSGVIRWEPREEEGYPDARYPVTVMVKPLESGVETAQTTFEVRVEEVNQRPRIATINGAAPGVTSTIAATEGEQAEVLIEAVDDDLPANPIELSPTQPFPGNARLVRVEGRERQWKLVWTPGEVHGGGDVVRVPLKVEDGAEAGPELTLAFRVAEINQPPVLAKVNGLVWREDTPWKVTANEEEPLELMLLADDADLPANPLKLKTVDPLPEGAELVPIEENPRAWKLRWMPGEAVGGDKPVTIRLQVADATDTSSPKVVVLDVAEVNTAPELAAIDGRTVKGSAEWIVSAREGKLMELALAGEDVDLPANPLSLEPVGQLPDGAKIVPDEENPRTWRLHWTPGEEFGGDKPVRIPLRVKDRETAGAAVTLVVKVAEVNAPPVFETIGGRAPQEGKPWEVAAREGEPLELTIVGGDADLPPNPLTLEPMGRLPAGVKIVSDKEHPRVWKVQWTPGEEFGGEELVRIPLQVKDGETASAVAALVVKVAEVNAPPVFETIGGRAPQEGKPWEVAAREGEPLELTIVGGDADLPPNPLTLEPMGRLPAGAKIVPDKEHPRVWKLQWTPGEEFGGEELVRIPLQVKDGETASAVAALVVKVAEVNVPPVFETIGGRAPQAGKPWEVAAREGEPLELTIVGGDADRPANPLQLVAARPLPDGAKVESVQDQPRQWKLTWTPAEEHGGGEPVEFSLSIKDTLHASEPAVVMVRVAEVNSPPVLPELAAQTIGAGETWTLDVPVKDPDLPRQELQFELEQPEGMGAVARWLETENGPRMLRLTWRPDAVADLGAMNQLTLRVRDIGKPALSAERTFEIVVGRYVRNSIGMEFALVPAGEFRMGNLDPEGLQKITPKAPPKPPTPKRPGGVPNDPFRNPTQPGQPFDPAIPGNSGTGPASEDEAAADKSEAAKPEAVKPDDLPVRSIVFTKPVYFGAFEVTQQQFESVMGANPSYFSLGGRGQKSVADVATERLPVDSVSYSEAVEFCRRLSARPEEQARGRTYRLPTEAEWEYACRAGTGTLFSAGDRLSSQQANFDGRYPLPGMEAGPFLERTAVIGSYEPNAFGIHDMHGNVSEWCHDWYAADAYEMDSGPAGPESGERRVIRGGNYRSPWAYLCRSSIRDSRPPIDRVPRIGFRVVMEERPVGPALPAPRE